MCYHYAPSNSKFVVIIKEYLLICCVLEHLYVYSRDCVDLFCLRNISIYFVPSVVVNYLKSASNCIKQ